MLPSVSDTQILRNDFATLKACREKFPEATGELWSPYSPPPKKKEASFFLQTVVTPLISALENQIKTKQS